MSRRDRVAGSVRDLVSTPGGSALLAGAVAVLAYANALGLGFAYDDVHVVLNNDTVHTLHGLASALFEPYWTGDQGRALGLWRPVTTAGYAIQYVAWGGAAVGFHLVNVLLHGAATVLTVLLVAELLPLGAALAAGLLFAVHPVHVEAVANVVGLGELLPAVLFLAACVVAVRGGERLGPGATSLVALLYAAAFLGKESAVTLPAVIFLLDALRRRIAPGDLPGYLRARGPLYLVLTAVVGVLLVVRWRVLGSLADPDPALGAHLLREIPRVWTLGVIWGEYVRLLLFPARLYADYAPAFVPVLTVWTPRAALGAALALGALLLALLAWRRGEARRGTEGGNVRILGFGVLWFVVTVSPVSNVLILSGVLVAERTLYLPSVGIVAALGWIAYVAVRRWRLAGPVAALAVLGLLGARTWTRTPVWDSTTRVFADMIESQPTSGRAQWVLGDILRAQGRDRQANRAYRAAVGALDSSYRLLMEIGWDAVEDGDHRLGEFMLRRAAEAFPDQDSAHRRLAVLYVRQGRSADVIREARRVVELDPGDVASWHMLAGALTELGRWGEAASARERVIALGEGAHWQQWLSLARLRLTLGDTVGSREALDTALERALSPDVKAEIEDAFAPFPPPTPSRAATPPPAGVPGTPL